MLESSQKASSRYSCSFPKSQKYAHVAGLSDATVLCTSIILSDAFFLSRETEDKDNKHNVINVSAYFTLSLVP